MITETKKVYLVRVTYKSRAHMDFECLKFTVSRVAGNLTFQWDAYGNTAPIFLNADEVESVWTIAVREVQVKVEEPENKES